MVDFHGLIERELVEFVLGATHPPEPFLDQLGHDVHVPSLERERRETKRQRDREKYRQRER